MLDLEPRGLGPRRPIDLGPYDGLAFRLGCPAHWLSEGLIGNRVDSEGVKISRENKLGNHIVSTTKGTKLRPEMIALSALALTLGLGWASREYAFAQEKSAVKSQTVTLDQVKMNDYSDQGKQVGKIGIYVNGDAPRSSNFVTGRFVLDPGQSPHTPHTHAEEEVMIIESGHGDIFCDGKTTKVGPGSVMFTAPNDPHGIVNTGKTPLVFYFIKWEAKAKN